MAKVTFRFEEGEPVVTYATEGERLLEVAQKSNVPIDAPCSGNASCGKCRVRLVSGELDSKITRHISEEEYQNGWRLACVSTVKGDVEVEVPDIASAYRSRMKVADLSSPSEIAIFEDTKKKITDAGLELKNSMQVITISMEEPTLDDTMPDNERVTWAVQAATGLDRVRIPYSVLKKCRMSFGNPIFRHSVSSGLRQMTSFYTICFQWKQKQLSAVSLSTLEQRQFLH